MHAERPFDVVVIGATGVTGRQVVRYLAEHAGEHQWAIAVRNPDAAAALVADADLPPEVAVLSADASDPEQLRSVTSQTRVLANAVGPASPHVEAIWRACIDTHTHQVDLSADIYWLREAIAMHERAVEADVSIVHSAGFLALPFDLAAAFGAELADRVFDEPLADLDIAIDIERDAPILQLGDMVSAGTIRNTADVIRRGGDLAPSDVRLLDSRPHDAVPYDLSPRQHARTAQWLAPMVPVPHVNPVIVHRSASSGALGAVTSDFRIRDGLVMRDAVPGVPDSISALWVSGSHMMSSMLGAAPSSLRNLWADGVQAMASMAGSGPDERRLSGWSWRLHVRAATASGQFADFDVRGEGHLGYRSSANLLGEAALILADGGVDAGVLTPAMAFAGHRRRFERAGMRFEAVD